jgi:AcrR family transcriptional regulator
MPEKDDQETRQRLLDAAAQLFAERGFNDVSIRDICSAANANVAAVNYYFHDKWGLYKELLDMIIEDSRAMIEEIHTSPPGTPAEKRLRKYIRGFLRHGLTSDKASWKGRLMGREMIDPTLGLDLFIQGVILPNSVRVGTIVSELMGLPPTDPRVGACVGSVQTQIVGYFGPVVKRIVPDLKFTPEVIEGIANHITAFSLAGIRAIAQQPAEVSK